MSYLLVYESILAGLCSLLIYKMVIYFHCCINMYLVNSETDSATQFLFFITSLHRIFRINISFICVDLKSKRVYRLLLVSLQYLNKSISTKYEGT